MIAAPDGAAIKEAIGLEARALGFQAVGFAAAECGAAARAGYDAFVAAGWHGDMGWLARNAERRRDPKALWPEARTILVLGMNYGPAEDPLRAIERREAAAISVYAQGRDYHEVIKSRLKQLGRWIHTRFKSEVKVFVDTAPILEKPLGQRAGLGWQGKHTNLVSRDFGSWLFLSEIFLALELPPDSAESDHCGTCARCIEICPTQAIVAPYRLDARRCISYLTIEHDGPIPRAFRRAMGNRIYGCDDCLAVCPWNRFASKAAEAAFAPRASLEGARLGELARLDDAQFRALFAQSAVKRLGRDRFVRNVAIALGNTGSREHEEILEGLLGDASPLVRGASVWALGEVADSTRLAALKRAHEAAEPDVGVREEWANVGPPT